MIRKTIPRGFNVYDNYWRIVHRTYAKPLNKKYEEKDTSKQLQSSTRTLRNTAMTAILGGFVMIATLSIWVYLAYVV